MPEICCCSNVLREGLSFRMVSSPCRCPEPGDGKRCGVVKHGIPDGVFSRQWNQRRKLGLPIETGSEKEMRTRWI